MARSNCNGEDGQEDNYVYRNRFTFQPQPCMGQARGSRKDLANRLQELDSNQVNVPRLLLAANLSLYRGHSCWYER
jgi:hypothetical protein